MSGAAVAACEHTQSGWPDAVLTVCTDRKRLLLGTDAPRRLQAALERAVARKAGA